MRYLLLRLTAMLLPTLVGLQLATQVTAAAFGYYPALGSPTLTLGPWRLYAPWRFAQWLWVFGSQHPHAFDTPLLLVTGGVLLGVLLVGLTMLKGGSRGAPTTYGSARWSNASDVRRSGLL